VYFDYGDYTVPGDQGYGIGQLQTDFTSYLNKWTHVVLTSNGVNRMQIFLNGVKVAAKASASSPNTAHAGLHIGEYVGEYHNGVIDDFRIYNRVLSDSEVQQLYNLNAGQNRSGALFQWKQQLYSNTRNHNRKHEHH
jgi:Concanavalin A-like lectin/glucanases superfamily